MTKPKLKPGRPLGTVIGAVTLSDGTVLPLREAKQNVLLISNNDDLKNAVCGDPKRCMLSNTARRTHGCEYIEFYRTVAYLDFKDRDGKRHIERFTLPAATMRAIQLFDDGKVISPEGYYLQAPTRCRTKAAMRGYSANRNTADEVLGRRVKHRSPDSASFRRKTGAEIWFNGSTRKKTA